MAIKAAIMVPHPPLIVPDVGGGIEKEVQATIDAYDRAAKFAASFKPDTIIVSSPHQIMYTDYFHISPGAGANGSLASFGAPGVRFNIDYDEELVRGIAENANAIGLAAGTWGERDKMLDHGTMVPLYFINKYLSSYKLVRVGLSGLSLEEHYMLGQCIQRAVDSLGRNAVFVASGDLSHKLRAEGPYGFAPEGPIYDERIMDVMGRAAFGELFDFSENLCDKAAECGHRSFVIMAGALDGMNVEAKRLSHEDTTGVGYGVCTYECTDIGTDRRFGDVHSKKIREAAMARREGEDEYVALAHRTIDEYVQTGNIPALFEGLSDELYDRRAGVFVSIKKDGRLRGCIGTIMATTSCIAEEIIQNAVSACSKDPRFSPIEPNELDRLTLSVDVLGDTEKISSPDELDVKRYGVIVTRGYKRGLLLPNLDGVDTVEQQISIARQKGGIAPDEKVELERFEVVRHY